MVPVNRLSLVAFAVICALSHGGCAGDAAGGATDTGIGGAALDVGDGGAVPDTGVDAGTPGDVGEAPDAAGMDGGSVPFDGGGEAGIDVDVGAPPEDGGGGPEDGGEPADDGGADVAEPAPCSVDFDCAPGESCVLGECGEAEPPCGSDDDCGEGLGCTDGVCVADGASPLLGKIVVNELLTDGSADEDANGDGTVDALEDELVELVNVSNQAVDLSGWTLVEADFDTGLPRHTFPAGTVLAPAGALVIFGGGDAPASTAAVAYAVANAADPGIPFGLDLDDGGDAVRLLDADGLLVALAAYGDGSPVPATSDQSLTRSPDLTGGFVPHTTAPGAAGASMSPGTRVDGGAF